MTPIAQKTKPDFISADTLTAETMIVILFTICISSMLLQNYVHIKLQIFTIPYILLLLAFLIVPNNKNKGYNGAQRIIIMCKYYIYNTKEKYYANR